MARERSERSGPSLAIVVLVSMITSAATSGAVVLALVEGWRLVPDEEVPSVIGLPIDAARGVVDGRGLRLVQRDERHDSEVEAGRVITQQPGAGSMLPRDSEVTVVVSLGPDLVEVPDLVGLMPGPARARLVEVGLRAGAAIHRGGEGDPGSISSTSPAAGQRVARGTEVLLTAVPDRIVMIVPDLTGMRQSQAREAITAAGLTVGQVRTGYDENRSPFIVLRQNPAPGTEADPGTAVELVINEE